jgi:hypothetical protein
MIQNDLSNNVNLAALSFEMAELSAVEYDTFISFPYPLLLYPKIRGEDG